MFCGCVDRYRFVMCILVVLIHSVNTEWFTGPQAAVGQLEHFIVDRIAAVAVPGFYLVSGYLFFRNFTMDRLLQKYKNRIWTIVIPFLSWNTLYYIINYLLRRLPGIGAMFEKKIPLTASELFESVFLYKWNPVFWYMQFLIIFIVLAPVLWRLLRSRVSASVTLCMLIFISSAHVLEPYSLKAADILQWLIMYAAGAALAIHGKEFTENFWYRKQLLCVFACIGAAAFVMLDIFGNQMLLLLIYRFSGAAVLWFLVSLFPRKKEYIREKNTFYIYAVHHLLAHLINKLASHFLGTSLYIGGVLFFAMPALIVLFCDITRPLLNRYLPRTSRLLGI